MKALPVVFLLKLFLNDSVIFCFLSLICQWRTGCAVRLLWQETSSYFSARSSWDGGRAGESAVCRQGEPSREQWPYSLSGSSGSSCGKSLLGFFWLWSWCCFRLAFTIRVILCSAELLLSLMLEFGLVWFCFFFRFNCTRFSKNYVFRIRLWMALEHEHLKVEN